MGWVFACAMDSLTHQFGVALFGAGRIGCVHMKSLALNPRVKVIWVVEEDQSRGQALVNKYNLADCTSVVKNNERDQVFKDPRVEFVVVGSPSFTHEVIVKEALEAGKAVFCEKPLAPSIESAKACYDLAEKHDRPLFCAFNRRFDPQNKVLFKSIRNGDLGKLRMLKTTSRDPPPITKEYVSASGGIFVDSTVHDIDLLSWLVGQPPVSVFATGHASESMFSECGDVDTCALTLKYTNGAVACIEVSRNASYGFDQRTEVFGSKGMMKSENNYPLNLQLYTAAAHQVEPWHADTVSRYAEAYMLEMEHFIDVMEGKESVATTRQSVLTSLTLAMAAMKSHQTGRVVFLEEDEQYGVREKV